MKPYHLTRDQLVIAARRQQEMWFRVWRETDRNYEANYKMFYDQVKAGGDVQMPPICRFNYECSKLKVMEDMLKDLGKYSRQNKFRAVRAFEKAICDDEFVKAVFAKEGQ